ncbi:twin-arginine translocation signal domain-containing protein [Limisphaera ngatamarikiensis]|uniref:Twin-arginine translocation signal domain-containing protein n=1 Tax=Limisphaera ngatamarikiensis TaxID=1324935 RepID=A0A6M1RTV6_9BACT|nr:twin-arginine translocation signal domain-containing protein [Limisphaera ngatamarikiensis]NGO38202.1 twin-arginine translocation signal domain-containing protein [Limisphaera ngatamarikiensis]
MNDASSTPQSARSLEEVYRPMTRRTFLKGAAASLVGMAGLMAALRPLLELERGEMTLEQLLWKH